MQKSLSTAQQGVLAAFELSWLEVAAQTQQVAALISLFAPEIFAWEWVESASRELNWASEDVERANEQLYERHLIQWVESAQGDYRIRIHSLIREFLKVKLVAIEQVSELKQALAKTFVAIAKRIPYSATVELINSVKDAIPHLVEVAQNLIDAVIDEDLYWVFTGLGRFYEGQGLYALAQPWYKQGVSVVRERLGEKHPDVASSYNNLALLYSNQGRYSEAEPLYIKALELRQRLLTEEHPDVATSYNDLALLYYSQGRYSEAEPLYIKALEIAEKSLGENHPNTITIRENLKLLYEKRR